MTRSQFIAAHSIEQVLRDKQIKLAGSGNEKKALCPFHQDTNESLAVNVSENSWFCHSCGIGGGVIDFLAKTEKLSPIEFIKRHQIESDNFKQPTPKPIIAKTYDYHDERGNLCFQVVRLVPKSFRQRKPDGKGNWVWSMEGVNRVLYRLPQVIKSDTVWIVEGEKDADNLCDLGFTATCNVGGAGKWLDGYTTSLAGKNVVLCGDNDDAGHKHMDMVFDSIAGKVKTARVVTVPVPHKDVSDFISAVGREQAQQELTLLMEQATPFADGIKLAVFSMMDAEPRYRHHATNLNECTLDLTKWLPSLKDSVRGLVPGEVVLVIGDTGTGKTALLQSIAMQAKPLPTLMFEMELPEELLFERFVAMATRLTCSEVETTYRLKRDEIGTSNLRIHFPHLFLCTQSNLTLADIERIIIKSELKIGKKPLVVLLDYVQLVAGVGNRYERTSDTAEGIKTLAKSTHTIIVVASQVHRPESGSPEITLHSAKDSGSLENTAGLVLGAWRDTKNKAIMHIKVLKSSKGSAGKVIDCNFTGENMRITECSKVADVDVPRFTVQADP